MASMKQVCLVVVFILAVAAIMPAVNARSGNVTIPLEVRNSANALQASKQVGVNVTFFDSLTGGQPHFAHGTILATTDLNGRIFPQFDVSNLNGNATYFMEISIDNVTATPRVLFSPAIYTENSERLGNNTAAYFTNAGNLSSGTVPAARINKAGPTNFSGSVNITAPDEANGYDIFSIFNTTGQQLLRIASPRNAKFHFLGAVFNFTLLSGTQAFTIKRADGSNIFDLNALTGGILTLTSMLNITNLTHNGAGLLINDTGGINGSAIGFGYIPNATRGVSVAVFKTSTSVQTWTNPNPFATYVRVTCVGGGGGGGGGKNGAANAVRGGGSGGGGGAYAEKIFLASDLPSTVTVYVGVGGLNGSGALNTTANSGIAGLAGGNSSFFSGNIVYLNCYGGGGGAGGGTAVTSGGGGGGTGDYGRVGSTTFAPGGAPSVAATINASGGGGGGGVLGLNGGNAENGGAAGGGGAITAVNQNGGTSIFGCGGGGAGGGMTSTNTNFSAGMGGAAGNWTATGGGAGTAGTQGGMATAGAAGSTTADGCGGSGGGGGGGSSAVAKTGAAGYTTNGAANGGDGGFPGGGGGGGGGGTQNGGNAGGGGLGGNGTMIINTW